MSYFSPCFHEKAEVDAAIQLLLKLKVDYRGVAGQDYKAGCPPSESAPASNDGQSGNGAEEDTVDPWNVATNSAKGVDYDKLIGNWQGIKQMLPSCSSV